MGFFDFLRRPKQEKETIELSLEKIGPWLDSRKNKTTKDIENQLKEIKKQIEQEKSKLLANVQNLETAEIKNQKIPGRAKNIMEGNRPVYIQRIRSLNEKINLPEIPEEARAFAESFDKELSNFEQSIGKAHRIMEEFFLEKASIVSTNIKTIDKLIKESKSLVENSELKAIEEVKENFSSLLEKTNKKENLGKSIKEQREKINSTKKELKENERELNELQESETYKLAKNLVRKKESLGKQIAEINAEISSHFSQLETALKKYENLSENKLAREYLEEPLNALMNDMNLEILNLLQAIKTAATKDEIILKEKKKDKTLKTISLLNKEYLETFLEKNRKLNEALSDLSQKIKSNESLKKETELREKIKSIKKTLADYSSNLKQAEKEFEKIEPQTLREELEKTLLEKLNEEVKII